MPSIVINADDYGLTDGVCRSIKTLLDLNAISNTTIMIAADGAPSRCRLHDVSSIAGRAGVHLQLTGGRPISPLRDVPSLVDRTTGLFLPPDQAGNCHPGEVLVEWRRQIETVAALLGERPTHLDSHHGAHRLPEFTPAYLTLAVEFHLPVRGGTTIGQLETATHGVRSSAVSVNTWTGRGLGLAELKTTILQYLHRVKSDTPIEIVTHPGFCDATLASISGLNILRETDHAVLLAFARDPWLEEQHIRLVRYPSLR